jgi:hypothetical protein
MRGSALHIFLVGKHSLTDKWKLIKCSVVSNYCDNGSRISNVANNNMYQCGHLVCTNVRRIHIDLFFNFNITLLRLTL